MKEIYKHNIKLIDILGDLYTIYIKKINIFNSFYAKGHRCLYKRNKRLHFYYSFVQHLAWFLEPFIVNTEMKFLKSSIMRNSLPVEIIYSEVFKVAG